MDTKINLIKNNVKKHGKKFPLFLVMGIFKVILTIGLTWLFIDFLNIGALLGSTIGIIIVFFITYFMYAITKVIKPEFIRYTSATIGFNIATILLIWFSVDFVGFSGAYSSAIVIGILFIIRYVFLNKIGLIQHE